jgi:hypothetical protein
MSTSPVAVNQSSLMRGAARFAIIVGIALIATWAWLLVTGDVPDLDTDPVAMWFHIAGEIVTALALIAAGWGLLSGAKWARRLHILASGMLLVVVIHAVAWYGERGDVWMVVAFLVLAVVAVFFAIRAEE